MNQYIALLRGINVGGYRKIRMEDLREMFTAMGFEKVKTYIQSGNVVFVASGKDRAELSHEVKNQIKDTFGHEVPVIIRTPPEMEKALVQFPFEEKEGWKGYISFLADRPTEEQRKELESLSSGIEKFIIARGEVFSIVDKKTKEKPQFSNSFVEKKLKIQTTTRNLRTVRKILELTRD